MYILFDIGGTNTRVALSDNGSTLRDTVRFPTPHDFDAGVALLALRARQLTGGTLITGICGGLPGPLDREHTMTMNAPNLPDWNNKPFKSKLINEFKTDNIHILNDAAAAGLGEAVHGAGTGKSIVAYLTVSTGIGGARIVDGKIDNNSLGFEPGHQVIDIESGLDMEETISGSAIKRIYGREPAEITDEKFWDEEARLLAIGLNNTAVHWSPDIIVLGGSMMHSIPLPRVREYLARYCRIFPTPPPVTVARLWDDAGLYGAMAYIASPDNEQHSL